MHYPKHLINVKFANGKSAHIRKSTLVWFFKNQTLDRVSSDRLGRFICANKNINSSKKYAPITNSTQTSIEIGDWCGFNNEAGTQLHVGQVVGFSYLNGTRREREYSLNSAPIYHNDDKKGSKKGVGVLCNWYSFNMENKMQIMNELIIGFHPIQFYVCHIDKPIYKNCDLILTKESCQYLKKFSN